MYLKEKSTSFVSNTNNKNYYPNECFSSKKKSKDKAKSGLKSLLKSVKKLTNIPSIKNFHKKTSKYTNNSNTFREYLISNNKIKDNKK